MREPRLVLLVTLACFFSPLALGQRTGGGKPAPSPGSRSNATAPTPNRTPGQSVGGVETFPTTVTYSHAEDEGKVEFRSDTVLVEVPVVVTDKSGNHIKNLKKEDFQILENGKEQNVASFEEVTTSNQPLPSPANSGGVFSNAVVTGNQPRNITIIALDSVNTPYLDQIYGRKELIKYLAGNVSSGQIQGLVIITTKGLKVVQGITGDPAQLVQALKKISGEMPALQTASLDAQAEAATGNIPSASVVMAPATLGSSSPGAADALDDFVEHGDAVYAQFQQANAIETTMRAFLGIALSLSGVPGRKSLIWATGSFPFSMDSPSTVPGGILSRLYERAMLALNDAEISVYPIDVRGLVNYSPAADITISRPLTGQRALDQFANRAWLQTATLDTLNSFADMTGGRAFYNSNDIATGFKRAVNDSVSYYLLSYYLDTKNRKPGWRKMKVTVRQADVQVRSRSGFLVTNITMNPSASRQTDIDYALIAPVESTGVPITVRWLGTSGDGKKKKVDFALHVAPAGITLEGGSRNHFDLDFIAAAYTVKENQAAANLGKNMTGSVPDNQLAVLQSNGMGFKNTLELPSGEYNVRFIVRDNATGRLGSVIAPLTVN